MQDLLALAACGDNAGSGHMLGQCFRASADKHLFVGRRHARSHDLMAREDLRMAVEKMKLNEQTGDIPENFTLPTHKRSSRRRADSTSGSSGISKRG